MSLFACSAQREYEFVKERFGYPPGAVQLLGLCRFDNLLAEHEVKRQILVMPTMREWLRDVSLDTKKYENTMRFENSEFAMSWNSFLSSPKLGEILSQNNVDLVFYLHASMQKYADYFPSVSNRVKIAQSKDYDVQQLLMESAVLITDYSSVFFDFAYMKKPILYYQFDYEKYRLGQYQEGYFSYSRDGFGTIVSTEEKLISELKDLVESNFVMLEEYRKRVESFFAFTDSKNCMRTSAAIKRMGDKHGQDISKAVHRN
jgi:CDP-glycerol glycerophosphotransferase (TagB/SpsB family)